MRAGSVERKTGAASGEFEYGERWDVFCAMPPRPRCILDLGCGSGRGFQSYRRAGSRVVGVDIDPQAVAEAATRLDEVILMNVESQAWPQELVGAFDVVAFCDCLEHLADPWSVLRSVRELLRPGGVVVASIPNLRQWRIIVKLALGRFEYVVGPGTVNRAHLRFFTQSTVTELFRESGYENPHFYFPRETFHLRTPERLLNAITLGLFPGLLYGSYTVSARPAASR